MTLHKNFIISSIPTNLRSRIKRSAFISKFWGPFRNRQLISQYRARREYYANLGTPPGSARTIKDDISARLSKRGYTPPPKHIGQLHTFAFIPQIGWHSSLLPDLTELGKLTLFDYTQHGITVADLYRLDGRSIAARNRITSLTFEALKKAHHENPVDWVFVYASGVEVHQNLLKAITETLGIPIVNMCLDDKQSWQGPLLGDQRTGQIDIARHFDLSWTSASVAIDWYLHEGARPIYLPEGFDQHQYRPLNVKKDIPVSFIGDAYGFRPAAIQSLRRANIDVTTFGRGWGTTTAYGEEQVQVINRSHINLGMGGIGYSESLTNVKTRDFEIPGCGGGMYLTSFNSDIAQHYEIGREIVCYRNEDELVELIRYHLKNRELSEHIAQLARTRCLKEHRWLHRYIKILEVLGIFNS